MYDSKENKEQVQQQNVQQTQTPQQPAPEVEDTPFKQKLILFAAVLGVIALALFVIVPMMSGSNKGTTSIIEENKDGGYRDLFK